MHFSNVNEQTELQPAEAQLRKDLLRMNWKQHFDGFEFRDNFPFTTMSDRKASSKRMSSYMIGIAF
jgi:hypothetical protein